jgi:preprotein translocase subunit SecE
VKWRSGLWLGEPDEFVHNLVKLLIWVGVVGVVFAILWWKGYLLQISNYVQQTREELRKCTWPTWDELKGSTVLIAISMLLLGGFIVVADVVLVFMNSWISKL